MVLFMLMARKNFALGTNRKVVLVDTFGTLDEDRWWDAAAYSRR